VSAVPEERYRILRFAVSHPSRKNKDPVPRPIGFPGAQVGHPEWVHIPYGYINCVEPVSFH
jgi:hypothetical protein